MRAKTMFRALLLMQCSIAFAYFNVCNPKAGTGVDIIATGGNTWVVKCSNDGFDLHYDDTTGNDALVEGNGARCSSSNGWSEVLTNKKMFPKEYTSAVNFECRQAPPPCSFTPVDEIEFNHNKGTILTNEKLRCKNKSNTSLVAVEFNSIKHDSIVCQRRYELWTDAKGKWIAATSTKLALACVEYCASSGVGIKFDSTFRTVAYVSCKDTGNDLLCGGEKLNGKAKCDREKGWKSGNKLLTNDTASTMKFQCRPGCGKARLGPGVDSNFRSSDWTTVLTCSDPAFELFWKHELREGKLEGNKAICTSGNGWLDAATNKSISTKSTISSANDVTFNCRKAPPPCAFTAVDKIESINKDNYGNQMLQCRREKDTMLVAVKFNSNLYEYIKCRRYNSKWIDAKGNWIASTSTKLALACVEYCASSGYGINKVVDRPHVMGSHTIASVSCNETGYELFHGDKKLQGKATCKLGRGWESGNGLHLSDIESTMKFKCRKAVTTIPNTQKIPQVPTGNSPANVLPTAKTPVKKDDDNGDDEDKEEQPKIASAQSSLIIIAGASVGGIIIIAVIAVIIFKVISARKRRPAENKSNMSGKTKSMKTKSENTKTDMSGKTKSKTTKSENTNTDMSGKTKNETSKSEKSKTDQTKSEKTKSEMSETKSEKTKSKMSGKITNTMSGRKSEISGTGNRSSER